MLVQLAKAHDHFPKIWRNGRKLRERSSRARANLGTNGDRVVRADRNFVSSFATAVLAGSFGTSNFKRIVEPND